MAQTLYIDKAYLARNIAGGVLSSLGSTGQDQAIEAASEEADDYLAQRYTLPLVEWSGGLKARVADIAVWRGMKAKGFNPEGDAVIRIAYEDAIGWLKMVAAGKINPDVTDSSPGAVAQPSSPRASVRSARSRGLTSISDSGCRRSGDS